MNITAIDSVYLAVTDLDAACRPYERLGLRLSPLRDGRRTLHVGSPANLFAVHFQSADGPLARPVQRALDAGRALFAVALGMADFDALPRFLTDSPEMSWFREGEDLAWLPLHDQAGADLLLVRHTRPLPERHEEAARAGLLEHALPLRRLDHLAAVTPDLEGKTRFWATALGVPAAGEVTTPAMVIRQLRIGDAILELLGPARADSPIWKRPPGLISMASWEVADLEAVAAQAKEAGFTVTDPAAGVLPGTRVATVQGTELAGVNMQLLQYV
jgi:catechol 2,3-dioxygenase-like lactoylglutathione lyase family enzyme